MINISILCIYIIKRFDFLKDETYIYLWSNGVKVAYMALFSSGFFCFGYCSIFIFI